MGKRVFVSADWREPYDTRSWDCKVVDKIRQWGSNPNYGVEIVCTDDVHYSVINKPDCRRCDIKGECGRYIKWSSIVILVIGDNTEDKRSGICNGQSCEPENSRGALTCKYAYQNSPAENTDNGGVVNGNKMSYLKFETTKTALSGKSVILVFNSMRNEFGWIPSWYTTLKNNGSITELWRGPFWKNVERTQDCYLQIKEFLI